MSTDEYYNRYHADDTHFVGPMAIIFGIWNLVSVITMFMTGILDPSIIAFGPNAPLPGGSVHSAHKFVNIDTWVQWILLLIYTFMSQVILTQTKDTTGAWIKNRIYTTSTSQTKVQLITIGYQLSKWTTHILYIYVLMTQIDIILTSALANVISSMIITNKHMEQNTRKLSVDYGRLSDLRTISESSGRVERSK